MRTRRHFQPSLDSMPNRISPSGLTLHAVVTSPVVAGDHGVVASGGTSSGFRSDDNSNPTNTPTGAGTTLLIIQPVTVPTTLMC
ncbi:MAG: hypothetical protein ACLQGP_25280 [Isosphaeraceae bacterium]